MRKLPKHTVHFANFKNVALQKKILYIPIGNNIFKFSCSDKRRAFLKIKRKMGKYIYKESFYLMMLWFKSQES